MSGPRNTGEFSFKANNEIRLPQKIKAFQLLKQLSIICNWTERNTRMQQCTNCPKIKTALKILGVKSDMEQVPHSWPTNIRSPQTKCHAGDLALGICVVLQKQFLPLLLGSLHTITICQKDVHHYASSYSWQISGPGMFRMTVNYELSHTILFLLPYVSTADNSYLWEYHYAKEYKASVISDRW